MSFTYSEWQSSLEFYTGKTRKAQKDYRCDWCNAHISAGDRYWRATGMFETQLFTEKLCLGCCYHKRPEDRHEETEK